MVPPKVSYRKMPETLSRFIVCLFGRNDIGNIYDKEISYRFARRRTAEMTRISQYFRRDDTDT